MESKFLSEKKTTDIKTGSLFENVRCHKVTYGKKAKFRKADRTKLNSKKSYRRRKCQVLDRQFRTHCLKVVDPPRVYCDEKLQAWANDSKRGRGLHYLAADIYILQNKTLTK